MTSSAVTLQSLATLNIDTQVVGVKLFYNLPMGLKCGSARSVSPHSWTFTRIATLCESMNTNF